MQGIRELLRGSLGRSLRSLPDQDRLAAAWAVACGPVLGARAETVGLDDDGVLHVRVLDPAWREQFAQMRTMLTEELQRIAGVRLKTIHFEDERSARQQGGEAVRRSFVPRGTGAARRDERQQDRRKDRQPDRRRDG